MNRQDFAKNDIFNIVFLFLLAMICKSSAD